MTLIQRIAHAAALVCCAVAPCATEGSAAEVTSRLCDRQLTYDIVPPINVPPNLSRLSGVWKGTITLAGGDEICVAMVVKEVYSDGRVILGMTWNASVGGRENLNNFAGMGDAPTWPNKVENGELRIDGGNKWNGTHLHYVMKLPTAAKPDLMEGRWMTENHPQPIMLYRDNGR